MRAVVTGATGFLGEALARRLVAEGWQVTGLGRDELAGRRLVGHGVRFVRGEIDDAAVLGPACAGADVVFHCAALSSAWGPRAEFERVNVAGTRAVAAACRGRLVHVSSPTIHADDRDHLDLREDAPLPRRPINDYAATKLRAEAEVAKSGVPAVILRPQGIIGPGDRAILPRLLRVAARGVFPVIGDGTNVIDLTYVDNVVDALILAATAPAAVGRTYFVTNGEPVRNYELLDEVFRRLGIECRRRRLPFRAAYVAAGALEAWHRAFRPDDEPLLTRYGVCVLGRSRTLDISAARRDLGYAPRVPLADGVTRFIDWWKESGRGHA